MLPFIIMIVLQVTIGVVVVFVLKNLLDGELEKAAIEKFSSLKANPEVRVVNVYSFRPLSVNIEQELKGLAKHKFTDSEIIFEQNKVLKGGVVIKTSNEVLDFSLSSRLENFWS
jgi:F0F1-type ATP synthase delta subunit